jgi:hypothetical protein
VQRIYEQFDNQDRAALMDLFLSDRTHIDLAREMTDAGHPMSEHTVRAHRKSDCSCNWVA